MRQSIRWYRTLAWKFFLRTALAILMVLGGILWLTARMAATGAQATAGASLESASKVLDQSLEAQGRELNAGLKVFAGQPIHLAYIGKDDPASCRDLLLASLTEMDADLAVIVRPNGSCLASTTELPIPELEAVPVLQLAASETPEGAEGPGFHRGFLELKDGAQAGLYHVVARPLLEPSGTRLGAMMVGKRLDAAAAANIRRLSIARARKDDPAAHVVLLTRAGIVGSTMEPALEAQLQAVLAQDPRFATARAQVMAGARSDNLPLRLGGQAYLVKLNPLRGRGDAALGTMNLTLLPMEPYLRPWRLLERGILLAVGAGLLLALWAALSGARAVTAPLLTLTRAADALAEGDRPELPALDQGDEVASLSRAFRALLAELQGKEELLKALSQVRDGFDPAGQTLASRVSMAAVGVDATLMLPDSSAPGAELHPQRRRVTFREGDLFGGRYLIEGILGKGGMGVVLKVRDQQLEEEVALKMISPEHELSPAFLDQLKQEIKLARRITHKYVLRTYDFGQAEGIPFVTMEYLKGVTLKQLLDDRQRLPLAMLLRIGRQVAEGLEAAHAEGVVHRDIKPLNILFDTRGDAKIMDFGLAVPMAGASATADGAIFGTPRYMSPEQIRGERVDPRSDLYALGIMLFELATGVAPFQSDQVIDLLRLHLDAPIPRAEALVPELPRAFSDLLQALMAKSRQLRPDSAEDVVATLKGIAT